MANKEDVENSFWDTVKKLATDMVTLDVVTVTGNLELSVDKGTDIESVLGAMKAKKGKFEVVAYSDHQIDYDSILYVKKDPSPRELELVELHMETVRSAQEMRAKTIEFVGKIITGII
jgi:hypothetical protein